MKYITSKRVPLMVGLFIGIGIFLFSSYDVKGHLNKFDYISAIFTIVLAIFVMEMVFYYIEGDESGSSSDATEEIEKEIQNRREKLKRKEGESTSESGQTRERPSKQPDRSIETTGPDSSSDKSSSTIITAGYVFAFLSLMLCPPLFGVLSFVMGIILLTREENAHGLTILMLGGVCTIGGMIIGAAVFVYMNNLTAGELIEILKEISVPSLVILFVGYHLFKEDRNHNHQEKPLIENRRFQVGLLSFVLLTVGVTGSILIKMFGG